MSDELPGLDALLRAADVVLQGAARTRLLFCAEPDLHRGDPRAWMLPPHPPGQRGAAHFTATVVALPS